VAGTFQRHAVAPVTLRLFFCQGWRAHFALFHWMRPSAFFPTVIGVPAVQLVWFVYLGRYLGTHPASYYAVGNALDACATAGLFAPAFSVQNERIGGTLTAVLASPANRAVMFAGRLVPAVLFGFLTSAVMLVLGMTIAGVDIPPGTLVPLAAAMLTTAASCSAFGLIIGAVGLRTREAAFMANFTMYAMLLLCGINLPVSQLPVGLRVLGEVMPTTQSIEAARRALAGTPGVAGLLGWELLKAAVLLLVALGLLRFFERASRAGAALDGA
jgi:ABC-2 type transport system permease protein